MGAILPSPAAAHAANKETNIQVVLRCRYGTLHATLAPVPRAFSPVHATADVTQSSHRPLNSREQAERDPIVIDCAPGRREVAVTQVLGEKNSTKTFQFDKVFDDKALQEHVYHEVVVPIVEEVLTGYNCTIFAYEARLCGYPLLCAIGLTSLRRPRLPSPLWPGGALSYGQTGTGKTHTMEGARIEEGQSLDHPDAGIIPRTLQHLFQVHPAPGSALGRPAVADRGLAPYPLARATPQILSGGGNEFTVRVSQVELYNEELKDLLSPEDDNRKLRIFDDPQHKGCVIQNVEEVLVSNATDVIRIMQTGSNRRRNAVTQLNPNSSRSHCVSTITVHIKESTPEGEELMKVRRRWRASARP